MFSDMKTECPTYASEKKYAFLCQVRFFYKLWSNFFQVALGKSKDVQSMPEDKPDGDFNSLRVVGKNGFSTAEKEVFQSKICWFYYDF